MKLIDDLQIIEIQVSFKSFNLSDCHDFNLSDNLSVMFSAVE